ncbi:MAG: PadR family transcriptional regulator [Lachnospiraceae bacterium]|nr:PadR family transcriptional regulator [Lachnospiraceae bacterium]
MDVQLKRGLLDVCVLAAIRNEDSYGYKIIKDMSPYLEMSESTLYTILKRLESGKLLIVWSAEHGGRLRKYYRITDMGIERLNEFKDDWKEIEAIYRFITRETNMAIPDFNAGASDPGAIKEGIKND